MRIKYSGEGELWYGTVASAAFRLNNAWHYAVTNQMPTNGETFDDPNKLKAFPCRVAEECNKAGETVTFCVNVNVDHFFFRRASIVPLVDIIVAWQE